MDLPTFMDLARLAEARGNKRGRGPESDFNTYQKLLMCLFWLRNGFTYRFLAWLFEIGSLDTVKNYVDQARQLLQDILSPVVAFPEESERMLSAQDLFGGNITVIIDGAEHEIYSSTDKQLSYVTFSGKKSYHTLTKLIAVSPTGEILFISKSFPGGMNDLNLIQMPEILNAIQVSDDEFNLADRGFRGMEDYRILTPYTETNASRFTTYDKKFKAIRVKVENGILQVRRWRICHTLFRVKPMDIRAAMRKHHQIWLICAALVNFVNHGRRP
jgi:hypothetical protein